MLKYKDTKELNVVFGGCARDCDEYLEKTLENIDHYSSLFKNHYKIIVENGSKDKTKDILKNNLKKNHYFFFKEELNNIKVRTIRLAAARNHIIDFIKKNSFLNQCDYLVVMDLDEIGARKIDLSNLKKSFQFMEENRNTGAVFANQIGMYYDMWTLRHKKYCPDDCWFELLNYSTSNNVSLDVAYEKTLKKRKINFSINDSPIKVESAFGGFAIYRISHILKNKRQYVGFQNKTLSYKNGNIKNINFAKCCHVNFNQGLKEVGAEMYILPYLINQEFDFKDSFFPAKACLSMVIEE